MAKFLHKPETMMGYFYWLIGINLVIFFIYFLFVWASPMSMSNSNDVEEIQTILSEKENSVVNVISIGELGNYKDTSYQLITYKVTKDSVTTEKSVMMEVEKKFLNYQCKGILKP